MASAAPKSCRNLRSAVKGLAIIASVILVALGPPEVEGARRAARHSHPRAVKPEVNQPPESNVREDSPSTPSGADAASSAPDVVDDEAAAAVTKDRPRRKAEPCGNSKCWRPHHLALSDHPAWISKHMGYEDGPRRQRTQPPNHHSGGTGETLPWVVKRTHSDPTYQEKHWWRLRPHDEAVGPEVLSCRSVEPFKFYLMEEALLPNCTSFSSGKELVNKIPKGGGQHIGEMFLYWQLRDHPWRTYDPMEAQIVVVPMFATLLVRGVCGSIADGIAHVVDALEASPRYHLNQGKDFIMMTTDFYPQYKLMQGKINNKKRFVAATKNFIFVSRLNGKFNRLRPIQGNGNSRCILAAPYTSKHAVSQCVGNDKDGLTCPGLDSLEKTFEEFMQKRNLTMFFMGQADDRIAYQSRRQIVTELANLHEPNYIVAMSKSRKGGRLACGDGDPFKWNGCFYNQMQGDVYSSMLSRAKISLYSGGDDPTSSRFYDAFAFGTPQIVISEGFYDQGAPFRCAVDHASIYFNLNEITFQAAPSKYMHESLFKLMGKKNVGTASGTRRADLLRKKWEAQRAAAPDLLWHVPGSRVAHNVLEDAFRSCLTDYRGNNDGTR